MKRIEVKGVSKRYLIKKNSEVPTFRAAVYSSIKSMLVGKSDSYREIWALKDLSFEVQAGEILGISGPNGSGKSTLLKLIAQVTYPTSGEIIRRGRFASLIEVGAGFHPELTGRENIYLSAAIMGFKPQEVRPVFDEIVQLSGLEAHLDTPVKRFSSGMFVRLAVAIALLLPVDILLFDETLSVADLNFREEIILRFATVKQRGSSLLMVSHDGDLLKAAADSIIQLRSM